MATIWWTLRADLDLDDIYNYAARSSRQNAARLADSLVRAVAPLADYPRLGRVVPEFADLGLREVLMPPYRLVYAVLEGDVVEMQAIYHSSRDLRRHLREDFSN